MTKRLIQTALGTLFLAGMTGCIDVQTTVIVKKDGSGYIVDTMYLGKQAMGMMAMAEGMGEPGGEPAKNPIKPSKDDLAARATKLGAGVKFVSSKELSKADGSQGFKATYSFTDINKLKLTMASDGSDMGGGPGGPDGEEGGEKKEEKPVTFAFKKGNLTINMPASDKNAKPKEMTPEEKQQAMMGVGMMKGMMQGMRMRMMVKVDGEITDSNAAHMMKGKKSGKNQYVILYDINMSELDDEGLMKVMSTQESGSPAEAAAMLQGIKGIKMEASEKISVKFK